MKREVFKFIEHELYSYPETCKQIEQIKADIMLQTEFNEHPDENVGGSRTDSNMSTVEVAATALVMDKRLVRLEEVKTAIDSVYEQCDPVRQKLIRLKYWTKTQLRSWEGIATELQASKRTATRLRRKIVEEIAEKLGYF